MSNMRKAAQECLRLLEGGYLPENDGMQPRYDDRIRALIHAVNQPDILDMDYLEHVKELADREIATFTLAETRTYLTFIVRGERHWPGNLMEYIRHGELAQLLKRYLELTEVDS